MATFVETITVEKLTPQNDYADEKSPSCWIDTQNSNSNNAIQSKLLTKDGSFSKNDDVMTDTGSTHSSPSVITWSTDSDYTGDHAMRKAQVAFGDYVTKHSTSIKGIAAALFLIGYTIYLGFAIHFDAKLARNLLIVSLIVVTYLVYLFLSKYFGDAIYNSIWIPLSTPIAKRRNTLQW